MESPPPAPRAQAALPVDDEPDYADLDEDEDMTCPISYQLMHDPVRVLASGRIMDRSSIEMNFMRQLYYKQPLSCPMTCITVASMDDLQPLPKLQAYIRQHCVNTGQPPPKPCPGPFALLSDFLETGDIQVRIKAAEQIMQHILLGMTYEDACTLCAQLAQLQQQQQTYSDCARACELGAALIPTYLLLAGKHQQPGNPTFFSSCVSQLTQMNRLAGVVQLLSCDSTELQTLAAEALALLAPAHGARLAAAGVPAALVQLLRTSDDESVMRAAAMAVSQMMWKERGAIQQAVAAELRQQLCTEGSINEAQQRGTLTMLERLLAHGRSRAALVRSMATDLPMAPWLLHTLQTSDVPDVLQGALSLVLVLWAEPELQCSLMQAGVLCVLARVMAVHNDLQQPVEQALASLCAATNDQSAANADWQDIPNDLAGQVEGVPAQSAPSRCVGHLLKLVCSTDTMLQAAAAEALTAWCSTQGTAVLHHRVPDVLLQVLSSASDSAVQCTVAVAISTMLLTDTSAAAQALREHIAGQMDAAADAEPPIQLSAIQIVACLVQHGTQVGPASMLMGHLGIGPWLVLMLHCAADDAVVLSALDLAAHLLADATLQQPLVDGGILPALCRAASTSDSALSVVVSLLQSMCAASDSSVLQAVVSQLSDGMLVALLPELTQQLAVQGCDTQLLYLLGHPDVQLQAAAAQAMAEQDQATLVPWQVIPALVQQLLVTEHDAVQQVVACSLCHLAESLQGEVEQAIRTELSTALKLVKTVNSMLQSSGLGFISRLVPCCQGALSLTTLVTDMGVVTALVSLLGHARDTAVLEHTLELLSVFAEYEPLQLQLVQAGVLPVTACGIWDLDGHQAAQASLKDIDLHLLCADSSPDHQLTVLRAVYSLVADSSSQHSSRSTLVLGCDLVAQLVSLLHDSAEPAVLHAALSVLVAMAQSYHVQAALLHAGILPALSHCASASSVVYGAACAVVKALQDNSYIQVRGVTSPLATSFAEHVVRGAKLPELLQLLTHPDPRAQEAAVSAITRPGAHTAAALIEAEAVPALLQLLGRSADVSVQSSVGAALCKWGWQEQGPVREHTRLCTRWALANLQSSDQHKHLPAVRALSRLAAHSQQIVPLHTLLTDLCAVSHLMSVLQGSEDTEALQEALTLVTQLVTCGSVRLSLMQAGLCQMLSLVVRNHPSVSRVAGHVRLALVVPPCGQQGTPGPYSQQ